MAAVGAKFDVHGSDLATLVIGCLDDDGRIPKWRRAQFQHGSLPQCWTSLESWHAQGGTSGGAAQRIGLGRPRSRRMTQEFRR